MANSFSFSELRRSSGVFKKAILFYILLAIVPIMLVTLAATLIYTGSRNTQNRRIVQRHAAQNEMIINERLELYKNVFFRLLSDKDFIHLCEELNQGGTEDYSTEKRRAGDIIQTYIYTYSDIRGAAYISDRGECISRSKWYSSANEMTWMSQDKIRELLNRIADVESPTYLAMEQLNRYKTDSADFVVIMGMPVRNLVTKERCGILLFALAQKILLSGDVSSPDYGISELVTDRENRIMAGAAEEYINGTLSDYLDAVYEKRRISIEEHPVEGTLWNAVSIIDTEAFQRDTVKLVLLVIALMAVITVTFLMITFRLFRSYFQEIQKIAAGIEQYDANDSGKIDIKLSGDDELQLIVRRFNEMSERVNALVETLRDRNEEIHILETNRRRAEIKALEAQINPHFLYNTLDSINWRAIDHGEEEISDMLGMLGSLLRYSISNIDMIVLLRAEIEWLKKYVYLQRDRFNYSFDCIYGIEEEALDFPIYKMLLQPLIENSIIHAFSGMESGGVISVNARIITDDWLEIVIEDNGCGVDRQTLVRIQKEADGRSGKDSASIGISNVASRLLIYYQGEADFEIESQEGQGTRMTLRIPRKESE